jgi:uncharacterized protein involved in cysteine biosynthesis
VSGRLRVLMCLAVLGVLLVLGLVVASLTGLVGAVVYGVVAGAVVLAGVVRGRRLLAPPRRAAGRTCDCCTTTHFDPVKVI